MVQLICLLIPSFVSTILFEKTQKRKFAIREFLIIYAILTSMINVLCLAVTVFATRHRGDVTNDYLFTASFALKYLLLGVAIAAALPLFFLIAQKYVKKKNILQFSKKHRFVLSVAVSLSFSVTVIVFTPYDIFLGNSTDFIFSFSDFWWIVALFGLLVFALLTSVLVLLPVKLSALLATFVFSFTFCAYIQRMFLNLYITSMVGNMLDIYEHPIWCVINICIWIGIIFGAILLLIYKKQIWKSTILIGSTALIFVQSVAMLSVALTQDLSKQAEPFITKDGMFELGASHNIIVFILDHYDFSYLETVRADDPTFYDSLDGFTLFDNTSSVYSRTYPSLIYLMTGIEENYHTEPYNECIESAFDNTSFLPDLQDLGFKINAYTLEHYIGSRGKTLIDNYKVTDRVINEKKLLLEMLRCSFYFEMPYALKPYFWFHDEFNYAIENAYDKDDSETYRDLVQKRLSIGDYQSSYKLIHMRGAHSPYQLNAAAQKVPSGVASEEQWKGCVIIVKEYLEQMKTLGLYDEATIIITADHGAMNLNGNLESPVWPIMFVKPANAARAPLKTSHAPTSHTDLFPTIIEAAGGEYEPYGTPIFSIAEEEDRERLFYYSEICTQGETEEITYKIRGNIKDFSSWKEISSTKITNSMYAVAQ